ncbi:MAG: metallophosphoesterase [Pseudomonadota bacterium]
MTRLAEAAAPPGLRLYAVGDVHGCLAPLAAMAARIEADLAAHPVHDWRLILLGDYIDRGPDSAGVLAWIAARDAHTLALCGNHDAYLTGCLEHPDKVDLPFWLDNGGDACLASYGISPSGADCATISAQLAKAIPARVRALLSGLPRVLHFGDYLFVHAGLRPGVALAEQDPDDLIWIREPFLSSSADHGAVVVHGHTPVFEVAVRDNRIGLDTGLVFGGRLSCLVLEGSERWLLGADGRTALPAPQPHPAAKAPFSRAR